MSVGKDVLCKLHILLLWLLFFFYKYIHIELNFKTMLLDCVYDYANVCTLLLIKGLNNVLTLRITSQHHNTKATAAASGILAHTRIGKITVIKSKTNTQRRKWVSSLSSLKRVWTSLKQMPARGQQFFVATRPEKMACLPLLPFSGWREKTVWSGREDDTLTHRKLGSASCCGKRRRPSPAKINVRPERSAVLKIRNKRITFIT